MKYSKFKRILALAIFQSFLLGAVSIQGQTVSVNPVEYHGALSNPLKGFRPGLDDAGDPDYPFPTIVRHYIKWNEIENNASDGVQKIIDFCNVEWAGIEDMNVKVIPRVYLDWDDKNGNEYWPADLTEGDWSSPEFKDRVVNLIYKLGEAWDNDPRVAWVQTGIIGYWGEQENPVSVSEDGWGERLGEAFTNAFQNKKLIVRKQNNWPGDNWGVYWDSYGHPGQESGAWTTIRGTNEQGRYLNQIVEGEVAYNWGESTFDPVYGGEPEITLNNAQYSDNMIDVIRELHCTGLGWIANYDLDGSYGSNPDSIKVNADRMQKEFGYRFVIPEFSCSRSTNQSDTLHLNFKVKNEGSAPFYEHWPLAFVLIDETSHEIVWQEVLPGIDLTTWHPGDKYDYDSKVYITLEEEYIINSSVKLPANITSGQYMAGLTILEPYSQTPGIFFAVENFLSVSQTQPLCRIGIGEDLVGSETIDPSIFDDPVADNARYYTLTPQGSLFSLSTTSTAGGSVSPADGSYHENSTVTVTAIPVKGYEFTAWSGDTSGIRNPISIFMDSDKTFSASFAPLPGEAVPWEEDFNLPDSTTSDSAPTSWTAERTEGVFEVRGERLIVNKSGGEAVFSTGNIDISSGGVNISIDVEGAGGLDPITSGSPDYIKIYKIVDGLEELIMEHYGKFSATTWTDPNIVTYGNTLSLVIKTFVTFDDEYYYFDNLRVTPNTTVVYALKTDVTNGTISLDPTGGSSGNFAENTLVTLSAKPDPGYAFESWSGDLSGATNPGVITMDADKNVTATFSSTVGIPQTITNQPNRTLLGDNYPNPFSSVTSIPYQLTEASHVNVTIYNFLGQKVAALVDEHQPVGKHTIAWHAKNENGMQVSSGTYFYRLKTNEAVQTKTLILLK